jgi:hypothetical protein
MVMLSDSLLLLPPAPLAFSVEDTGAVVVVATARGVVVERTTTMRLVEGPVYGARVDVCGVVGVVVVVDVGVVGGAASVGLYSTSKASSCQTGRDVESPPCSQ